MSCAIEIQTSVFLKSVFYDFEDIDLFEIYLSNRRIGKNI